MFYPYFVFNIFEISLIGILILLIIILVWFLLGLYLRPYRLYKKGGRNVLSDSDLPPVSVIVYAKNESANLEKHLPVLLSQEYPEYEVIVINDGSTDESEDLLNRLESQYKNLYHTFIPQESRYLSRKKLALTVGIKAAKNDILLFIEANCKPSGTQWINWMTRYYTIPGTEIVLGYCAYRQTKGLFQKLVSYDNMITGMQYISAALAKRPFKGNGRNLSYRKEMFIKNKGFSQSLKLHAGDDDLFINTYATGRNTQVSYFPESQTEMEPIERYKIWKEIKVSRAATQFHYRRGSLFFYRFESFVYILFILCVCLSLGWGLLFNPVLSTIGIFLFIMFYLIKGVVYNLNTKVFQQKSLLMWLPLLDIMLFFFNMYVRIYRIFRGKNDYTSRIAGKKDKIIQTGYFLLVLYW